MDFDLNDEQRMLKDSVDRLMAGEYGFEQRKAYARNEGGFSREMWRQFAELGFLGLPFAEADGGFGGGPVETMILMEAFGGSLVLEPYLASIVLGGGLLRHGGSAAQREAILPGLIGGELLLAFAHTERHARYDLASVATTARAEAGGFVLNGAKGVVLHGDSADKLIVSARLAGAERDRDGIGLFIVDADAPGLSRRGYPTQDGQRAAEVELNNVRIGAERQLLGGIELIEQVVDEAIAALAAEAVGAMAKLHDLTIDYLKTRQQFGTAIGNFQVLQHRGAEMFVALEQARSMAMLACMMVQETDADERHRNMQAAKIQIGRSGRFVGQQAVQLHGGIGLTMEYAAGHYFKRLTMIDTLFGDADHHIGMLAAAGGLLQRQEDAA